MQMEDKIFLDTNIILYGISTLDITKHQIAKNLILEKATISSQVVNETTSNLIKKFKFDEDMVQKFIHSTYYRYEVVGVDKEIFLLASNIRSQYNFSYYDSIIVASALQSGCQILYSEDMQHQLKISNQLTIINPFKI